MKRGLKRYAVLFILAVVILGVAAGGYLYYKTTTPEYALAKTVEDVQESGVSGLRSHLTSGAEKKLETVDSLIKITGIADVLAAAVSQESIVALIESETADVTWNVKDICKGENNAQVILSFSYDSNLEGTAEITMLRENKEWKIDGIRITDINGL